MKWGLTDEESWKINQKERKRKLYRAWCGIRKFAWLPVQMKDGTYLWWEYYLYQFFCHNDWEYTKSFQYAEKWMEEGKFFDNVPLEAARFVPKDYYTVCKSLKEKKGKLT